MSHRIKTVYGHALFIDIYSPTIYQPVTSIQLSPHVSTHSDEHKSFTTFVSHEHILLVLETSSISVLLTTSVSLFFIL